MHHHYSPFQFSTVEQLAEPMKQVRKDHALIARAAVEHKKRTRNMGSTMPLEVAHGMSSTPTAHISPNLPDVCRDAHTRY